MDRDAVLNMRLPQELKDALRRAAADDFGRSISGMTVKILTEWLTAHGYLGATKRAPKKK